MKHLFTNDTDTVIATSIKDAAKVWEHWVGDVYDQSYEPWQLVDDESMFSVMFEVWDGKTVKGETVIPATSTIYMDVDEDDEPLPNGYSCLVIAKAKDWARSNKRQFLCSTEF